MVNKESTSGPRGVHEWYTSGILVLSKLLTSHPHMAWWWSISTPKVICKWSQVLHEWFANDPKVIYTWSTSGRLVACKGSQIKIYKWSNSDPLELPSDLYLIVKWSAISPEMIQKWSLGGVNLSMFYKRSTSGENVVHKKFTTDSQVVQYNLCRDNKSHLPWHYTHESS